MAWKYRGRAVPLMLIILFTALSAAGQTPRPTIFFTDLLNGPNTGGENNNGTILTIYGKNFGAIQGSGTVTVGGGNVAQYYQWGVAAPGELGLQKIAVGLGANAATGQVVVTTSAGASICANPSENCQFTVRAGNIRCVSVSGNDNNTGAFPSACWATIPKAARTVAAGDIAYILNGVVQTATENYNGMVWIGGDGSGAAGSPKAIVGYPGAIATVGACTSADDSYAFRGSTYFTSNDWWTIANMKACSTGRAIGSSGTNHWRVVGNDLSCPVGTGSQGCFEPDSSLYWNVYGNYVHDSGVNTKFYHGIYFSTDDSHIDLGWNTVARIAGCRGILFHSSPVNSTSGYNQFDILVHDNIVHDVRCDGINMATIDPSQGAVKVYNNVVYHVGMGPVPSDGGGNFACLYFADGTNNGTAGSGTSQVYNNTLYDCGSNGGAGGVGNNQLGAINKGGSTTQFLNLTDNIIQVLSGEIYVSSSGGSGVSQMSGSNNLWFGNGSGPSQTTSNVNADPLFVSIGNHDFTVQASSPVIGAGNNSQSSPFDLGGLFRPNPPSIGAYELTAGVPPVRPNPPTNLTVIVK